MEILFITITTQWTNKANKPHKFVLTRLDIRISNKYVHLENISIYYTWKNTRQPYKNNKVKIVTLTWNDDLKLPDGSYSMPVIQDYIEYIIKKHKTLPINLPVHIYVIRINNRLVFKIKDAFKLELQTPKTTKVFGSTKKLIDKTKNLENVPNLEIVDVVLVQCNLVDNDCQQTSEISSSFTPNEFYAYWLNIESKNLMFLKSCSTLKLDEIIIIFTDKNDRPLEIEDKVILKLLINK